MTTMINQAAPAATETRPQRGLWAMGWRRLKRNKVAFCSFWVVMAYMLLAVAGWLNILGDGWRAQIAVPYAPPSFLAKTVADTLPPEAPVAGGTASAPALIMVTPEEDPIGKEMEIARQNMGKYATANDAKLESLPFGADLRGRDVIHKTLKGASTSIFVGLLGALLSIVIGTSLGSVAGYFGGKVDDFLNWFYSVFTSVPDMLLLLSFAAVAGRGIKTIIIVMALTSWTGTFRLVRAEYLKLRSREYVQAASAIGASDARRMFVHILPNISHLLLVQFSLLTVALIKYEAILSFLGFGVGVTQVSLGSMLAEAPAELVQGFWWQMVAVTIAMSLLVTTFSLLIDGLRDALDPKAR
ncbi:ABC transporter permease [Amantichitinum ursilacus]|uniref:Dipeptide transport system permease protein DppC n=1 Tax=Amantichitinum ursilacus TaxID=857265 RepID=A0A0N0XL18_9NEIS|nr:ABC transporter permease [Amantichitinum ursilacus]KPC53716.1 Dipeptide transport system permease protein DppC [Amantichitinum ursilacus]